MKDLAQKLTLLCPFVFQTQNGCHSLSFGATKTFLKSQKTRKIIQWSVIYKFWLSRQPFLSYCQKHEIVFASYPQVEWFLILKLKSFSLGVGSKFVFAFLMITQKLVKHTPIEMFFWSLSFWDFFVAPKLSKWQPFCVQNTNGCSTPNS